MRTKAIFSAIVIFLFISCTRISFLHTIEETGENKIFKKELMGIWKNKDKEEDSVTRITIDTTLTTDSARVYSIKIFAKDDSAFGDTSYLAGDLFNLQNKLFMSVSIDFLHEMHKKLGFYNAAMMLPSYQIVRIYKITQDSLQIGQLNGDTLIHLIKTKKIVLKNEEIEKSDILILEKSNILQKKLLELEKIPNVYDKATLYRVK